MPSIYLFDLYFPAMEYQLFLFALRLSQIRKMFCILLTHNSEKISVKYRGMAWEEGMEKKGTLNSQIVI